MEGAGEDVLAILQGTKHSGLRVTLVPDNRLRSKRKCVLMDLDVSPSTRITQSSVETNTDRVFKNASEPMCDVIYPSSYQISDCKAVQSSFGVSELPQHSTIHRPSDQFADSLRKYPVQASSEILQRIINYSNIKQNTRKHNLKSIRSLLRKSTSQQMNRRFESGANTNKEIYERRPFNKTIESRYSSQKEFLSYTYDYLKCISLIPRSTDVRYLTAIKRCIRNRILEIVDERPALCPRIRSRYINHQRHCHGLAANPTFALNENRIQDSNGITKCTHVTCRNPPYSRRRYNFLHQPCKCHCPQIINKQNPQESLIRKLYPELDLNKKEIVREPKVPVPEGFRIKPHDGVDDEIISTVLDWLKSIPVYPNFSANDKTKQKDLANKLAENLISLKNQVDSISKAKNEIMLCVKDLPMWYPPLLNEKEQFINKIVDDLLKRLVNIFENELKHKVAQAISNLTYTEKVDIEKNLDDFVYKIKPTVLNRPAEDESGYKQALNQKILDLLNKLPTQWTVQKIHDVADKLVDQLLELPFRKSLGEELTTVDENTLRENILKWCETVPELKDIDFVHNKDLLDDLTNKLQFYKSLELNDEDLQELVKAIRIWLEKAGNSMGLRLNSTIKNRLSDKTVQHFFDIDYKNSLNKKKSSQTSPPKEVLEKLLKWYYSIQELADSEITETRKALERLAKEIDEIQSRDINFENVLTDLKEVITVWLQNMLINGGKHLDSEPFDTFVNKLVSEFNVISKGKKQRVSGEYGKFYKDIVSWIKDIPYLSPESHLKEAKLIQKLVNKLNNIRRGSGLESTIIEAITKFIKSLSESLQVSIHEEDIKTLKNKIFEQLQHTLKQRKRWEIINDLCQAVLTEFSHILQTYSNILDDTKMHNINYKFYRKFIDHVEKNSLPNWKYLLRQLNSILMQETTLPKHECEDLANNIITKLQRMFPPEIARRSTVLSQPVKAYAEPTRVINPSLDAIKKQRTQKDSNDSENAIAKNKNKRRHHRKTNLQAGDGRQHRKHSTTSTIYKSSNSDLDTRNSIEYYDNNYEISDDQNDHSPINNQKEFLASTPLSAAINYLPFIPHEKSSIGNVILNTQKPLRNSELSKHSQFLLELKNVITDWIKSIDPNSNNPDLENVVDSIASDIVDRQKYIQLSETKYTDNDELEHLKYQIFRKLNDVKKIDLLPQIMSKINSLHRLIKNVTVPDLIKAVNESHVPTTPVSYNSVFNKVRHWLDGVPSDLLKSGNIKQNPVEINKLVKSISNVKNNNQYDYEVEKNILLWLQNALRNCNHNTFHKLAEDLKADLKDTALKNSNLLIKDTSEFIDENISEAITAWLQTTMFHKLCTFDERELQKRLGLLLATNLTNILQPTKNEANNLNDLLIEEVQKYLKTIPIPAEFRNNIYYYKAAVELVEYLKQTIAKIKEMCDGIVSMSTTVAQTNTEDDYIHDLTLKILKNWCDNLPIHLGHSSYSKEQAQKLKHNIALKLLGKLSNRNRKKSSNDLDFETMLSDEIYKIFQNVPMNRELERSLPVLNSILIEKLNQAQNHTQGAVPKKILHDTLTKTLQEIENTPDLEQVSLNLLKVKLADAFINLHYKSSTDEKFRDNLKDKLYKEINKYCDAYLERYPYSPIDTDELRFNLYAILKKVAIPEMQRPDVREESSKLSPEKELTSKNATTQYSSPQFLPSTLNNEDKSHLEIIRKRALSYPEEVNSERPHKNGSPQLKEAGVLTEGNKKVEGNVQTSKTLLPETVCYSREIIPQVVIKEFYWDSNGSKQSLQMYVPPALTPHKIIPRNKETNNSQNQTESKSIIKVNFTETLPETRKVKNNKVDKAADATSQDNHEEQEHVTSKSLNPPVQESQNNQTTNIPKDSIHRQQQTEKSLHQYHRQCVTHPDIAYDNGVRERCWIDQPRLFDDDRYIRKDRQSSYLEDLGKTPDDRRILTRKVFLTPENRNKESMCCDQNPNPNPNPNWRIGESTCRRRCNTLKHCSKCCDTHCPYPTMAFFKKTF